MSVDEDLRDNSCEKAFALIMGHMDGTLMPAQTERLTEHIEKCGKCKADFHIYNMIQKELYVELEEAPDGFAEGVMQRLKAVPQTVHERVISKETVSCALWGLSSILFGLLFAAILNAEQIISALEESGKYTVIALVLKIVYNITSVFVENLVFTVLDVLKYAAGIISSYRYVFITAFAVVMAGQLLGNYRKKSSGDV